MKNLESFSFPFFTLTTTLHHLFFLLFAVTIIICEEQGSLSFGEIKEGKERRTTLCKYIKEST